MSNVVAAEVSVTDIGSRLVVARDIGRVGDDVLLSEHFQSQNRDHIEGLPSLVPHEADCALVHHPTQGHQVVVLALLLPDEVVAQVGLDFPLLLGNVRKINEEPGAHVTFQRFNFSLIRRLKVTDQEVAVLEEAAAPDLLRVPGGDQSVFQVVHGLVEVPVHALGDDGGVTVLCQGRV